MDKNKLRQRRLAAVHDISGLGRCSLTVALPVVSATGVECSCIPTALLSTHTGEFTGWTLRDLTEELLPIARHWATLGVSFDGLYTGYLATPEQTLLVDEVRRLISTPDTLFICDPAMADNGEYYANFGEDMCRAFRRLCAGADVITPNITEAALLTGLPYKKAPHPASYIDELLKAAAELGPSVVALTGVHPTEGEIGSVVLDSGSGREYRAMNRAREGFFYGAGDVFASALSALLIRGAPVQAAQELASALVEDSIEITERRGTPRRFGLEFESALPAYIKRVEALFGGDISN